MRVEILAAPTSRPSSVRESVVLPALVCEMSESETVPASRPRMSVRSRCDCITPSGRADAACSLTR
ncbi:hypothetical protein DCE93_12510 [Agromyces badenianii]|uniref:Uncharacterized protein n=1 Tax=Agromyces badenianii TaxID=2080742 RepID=A0A2S0WYD1_9MICO|nr:hypothetical protein DCE93_12510 [Agromyces badenianii]